MHFCRYTLGDPMIRYFNYNQAHITYCHLLFIMSDWWNWFCDFWDFLTSIIRFTNQTLIGEIILCTGKESIPIKISKSHLSLKTSEDFLYKKIYQDHKHDEPHLMDILEILIVQEQESLRWYTTTTYGPESVSFTWDVFSLIVEWKPQQCFGARNSTDSIWSADSRQ